MLDIVAENLLKGGLGEWVGRWRMVFTRYVHASSLQAYLYGTNGVPLSKHNSTHESWYDWALLYVVEYNPLSPWQ